MVVLIETPGILVHKLKNEIYHWISSGAILGKPRLLVLTHKKIVIAIEGNADPEALKRLLKTFEKYGIKWDLVPSSQNITQ